MRERYRWWAWSPAWVYEDAITTWRLCSAAGGVRYLKVRAVEEEPRLLDEADRLRWARDRLPVPEVIACGTESEVDWLLLTGLPGRDATTPELKARPDWLVPILARGLRRLHETPADGCPFRLTVEGALTAPDGSNPSSTPTASNRTAGG